MKTKIFFSIFLFFLAGYFISALSAQATVGVNCLTGSIANSSLCSNNEWCDASQNNTCQPVVKGTPCSYASYCSDSNPGLTCGPDGKCIAASPTNTGTSTNSSTTANPSSPSVSGSSGSCGGDANLAMVNGLCLPKNQFSGLANSTSLNDFLVQVIKFLLTLAGVVGVVILIIGGFWYITSAGNEEQAEKGRKAIINAIIGIIVVIMSYAIVTVINNALTQAATK